MGEEPEVKAEVEELPPEDEEELVILDPPEEVEKKPKGGDAVKQLREEFTLALGALGEQLKSIGEQSERARVYHEGRERRTTRRTAYKRNKRAAARDRASSKLGDTLKSGLGRRLPFLRRADD